MATSWVTETKEKENYTRLCRLIYNGGTLALRKTFDRICPPTSLEATLKNKKDQLRNLKTYPIKVLNEKQWDLLYPSSGAIPKSKDFDITLLFILLRNICHLRPPARGWDALPSSRDTSTGANLVRIKYYRNKVVAHASKADIEDTRFEKYWSNISVALVSLGLKQIDIDYLKTSLGTEDYKQLVEFWHLSDQDIKNNLEALKTDTSKIKTDTAVIKKDTSEIKTDTAVIKKDTSEIKTDTAVIKKDTSEIQTNISKIKKNTSNVKKRTSEVKTDTSEIKTKIARLESTILDMKSKMPSSTQVESEITKLAHRDFTSVIQQSCESYHQSTRQWILDQVEETVQKASSGASVVLIRAGPGMGKSIVAAKICDIYQKKRVLGGCHFFQHSNSLRNNPRVMIQSIARQLCDFLPAYKAALETKLKTLQGRKISELNCEELFTLLFEEAFCSIRIDHNVVIVIDALDECASDLKEEFENAFNNKLSLLPKWIQFVITTRPLPSCGNLSPVVQIEIDPSDSRNVKDLREFFTFELAKRNAQNSIEKLMEIASGSFLVAHFVLKILDENEYETEADILECFRYGLSSVYEYYFKRIHELIKPYTHTSDNEDESFFKMLEAMVAAESPIPKELFYDILCLKSENEVQRAKRKERIDAVHLLHTIFPVENDHVSVFHKSVTDWLNLDGENVHQFSVSASNGCKVLAQKSLDILKALKTACVKEGGKHFDQPLVLSESERFSLRFGLEYIHKSPELSQTEKDEIIKDFIIMVAISSYCYSSTDYSTDIKWFRRLYGGYYMPFDIMYNSMESDIQSSFGRCLSTVGDICLIWDILPTEQKQELLSLRIESKLPYYSIHPVVTSLRSAFQHETSSSSSLNFFQITNGFIAVNVDSDAKPPTSTVLNIKDDGSYGEPKTFVSSYVKGVSPDKKYLIITKTDSSKIELFDVTKLRVKEFYYDCPVNSIYSGLIFEDERWYIVMKDRGDPKIHILDGLNGQLHDSIEVGENEMIEHVSQCGHILISSLIDLYGVDEVDDEVDDDVLIVDDDDDGGDDFNIYDDGFPKAVLSLKTIHFKNRDKTISYNPPAVDNQLDEGYWQINLFNKNFKFSDDGMYFALIDKYESFKICIYHTNDGWTYKTFQHFYFMSGLSEIVFLSFSCLIIRIFDMYEDVSILLFYDLQNSKLIYSAPMKLIEESRLLVPPQHHTDNSIPTTLFALNNDGLVKYEFHNLERNL